MGLSGADYLNNEASWRRKCWAEDGQDGWCQSKIKRAWRRRKNYDQGSEPWNRVVHVVGTLGMATGRGWEVNERVLLAHRTRGQRASNRRSKKKVWGPGPGGPYLSCKANQALFCKGWTPRDFKSQKSMVRHTPSVAHSLCCLHLCLKSPFSDSTDSVSCSFMTLMEIQQCFYQKWIAFWGLLRCHRFSRCLFRSSRNTALASLIYFPFTAVLRISYVQKKQYSESGHHWSQFYRWAFTLCPSGTQSFLPQNHSREKEQKRLTREMAHRFAQLNC